MAKKSYVGINEVARKNKKGYIGINNVARKIKKAYVGIGGVARPCWSGGVPTYYGAITSLSNSRYGAIGGSLDNYALIIGGMDNTSVEAYDKNLTKSIAPDLGYEFFDPGRCGVSCVTNGRVLITNLYTIDNFNHKDRTLKVIVYDGSLTKFTATNITINTPHTGGVEVGDYAVFAGGGVINAYDKSLTQTISENTVYQELSSAKVKNEYGIFRGTNSIGNKLRIVALNTSLTEIEMTTNVTDTAQGVRGVNNENYALFGFGYASTFKQNVECYNDNLTLINAEDLVKRAAWRDGVQFGEHAIFAGGSNDTRTYYGAVNSVEMYDGDLTKTTLTDLSKHRMYMGAATVGNFAVFAGGCLNNSTRTSKYVDAYVLA